MTPRATTPATRAARLRVAVVVTGVAVALGVPAAWWATRPAASVGAPPTAVRPSPVLPPAPGASPRGIAAGPAAATATTSSPARLRVPALGVDAPVDAIGVTERGDLVIPDAVDRVGWYRFGPAPGAPAGSVVVAGHVDSARQGRGALFDLRSVEVGARIDLVTESGRTFRYRVTGRETIAKRRLPTERLFDREGAPRLVVITCGGPFDRATSSYRDNLVVAADPVRAG
jgi:sortase (surface protein transpeptidase)